MARSWTTSPKGSNAGFTVIELLVVIAIIGVLIALLLPAVQAAREAARGITCRSHLRQLALAVLNYNDSHRFLPASGQVEPLPKPGYALFKPKTGVMLSWVVEILPFIEETALYEQFNRKISVFAQVGDPQERTLPVLQCPSDPDNDSFFVDSGKRFAKGNYAAYTSPLHVEYQNWYPGALIGHRRQTLNKIVDGTSNTLLLAEVRTLAMAVDQRGAWALPWAGASLLAADSHPTTIVPIVNRPAPRFKYAPGFNLQLPNRVDLIFDSLYSCTGEHQAIAALKNMPCQLPGGINGVFSAAPRSLHAGGVYGVMLDTHVTFLANDINPPTFAALVSINDGVGTNH